MQRIKKKKVIIITSVSVLLLIALLLLFYHIFISPPEVKKQGDYNSLYDEYIYCNYSSDNKDIYRIYNSKDKIRDKYYEFVNQYNVVEKDYSGDYDENTDFSILKERLFNNYKNKYLLTDQEINKCKINLYEKEYELHFKIQKFRLDNNRFSFQFVYQELRKSEIITYEGEFIDHQTYLLFQLDKKYSEENISMFNDIFKNISFSSEINKNNSITESININNAITLSNTHR